MMQHGCHEQDLPIGRHDPPVHDMLTVGRAQPSAHVHRGTMRSHVVDQIGVILASAMMVPMQVHDPSASQRQEQARLSMASLTACMRTCDGEKIAASQISVFFSGFRTIGRGS